MNVLGIETSGTVGSVALCEWEGASAFAPLGASADKSAPDPGGRGQPPSPKASASLAIAPTSSRGGDGKPVPTFRVLWERSFTAGLIHGRELAPAVQSALEETGTPPAGLGLIAVSMGPGSYTGLRVGIAFAKTLAWSVRCPLVGVSSLAAMAENVAGAATAAPAIDAHWGQVYGAVYRMENGQWKMENGKRTMDNGAWREVVAPEAAAPEAFAAKIPAGAVVFGDALKRYPAVLMRPDLTEGDPAWAVPRAAAIARLGAAAFRASGGRDETMTLVPLYLRPTEAEVNAGLARNADARETK